MKIITKLFFFFHTLLIVCSSCQKVTFTPMTNFPEGDTVYLDMDLQNAVTEGIIIPTERQVKTGMFNFTFHFVGDAEKRYFYKIYYQNESYKFDESDSLASENFYGSWEEVNIGFKPIVEMGDITDSFRIVGNPRDEKIYYGADISQNVFNQENIEKIVEEIKNTPSWYKYIEKKAEDRQISIEKLMYLDAIWILKERTNEGHFPNRWKRNPRTGVYSFMLVVCEEEALKTIPDYIQYIGLTSPDSEFVNPYSWFSKQKKRGIYVVKSPRVLKTRAVLTPQQGVFVDELTLPSNDYNIECSEGCGNSDSLYKYALFKQFFSSISKQYTLRNIPLVRDVVSDSNYYTLEEYFHNATLFDSTQLRYDYPVISNSPCKTVNLSPDKQYINIINPGNKDLSVPQKESTGVQSRVGFTYGKFRGKIKFPVMLNQENVWNGLTYAFWLIYQDHHDWNNRRVSKQGYIDKGDDSENPYYHPTRYYSEIDIEIVKAAPYWPDIYYWEKENPKPIKRDEMKNNEVVFACTNWDLACKDPKNFKAGINRIPYKNEVFQAIRWYDLYKALTIKTAISNDIFKEEFYYYEIEWNPNEIIWRIGSNPKNMKVVGYVNSQYSSIPNNQMLCIITQEYHYSEWWPPIVFEQGLIPYNQNDIKGRVYEIVIE